MKNRHSHDRIHASVSTKGASLSTPRSESVLILGIEIILDTARLYNSSRITLKYIGEDVLTVLLWMEIHMERTGLWGAK